MNITYETLSVTALRTNASTQEVSLPFDVEKKLLLITHISAVDVTHDLTSAQLLLNRGASDICLTSTGTLTTNETLTFTGLLFLTGQGTITFRITGGNEGDSLRVSALGVVITLV